MRGVVSLEGVGYEEKNILGGRSMQSKQGGKTKMWRLEKHENLTCRKVESGREVREEIEQKM